MPDDDAKANAKREAYADAAQIVEMQAFGAEALTANALRAAAALLRAKADRRGPDTDRRRKLGWDASRKAKNINGRVKERRRVESKSVAKRRAAQKGEN
jgi:hypothetical protein